MGIPLFAGFWGKIGLLKVLSGGNLLMTIGLISVLAASVIEGFYFMRVSHSLFETSETDLPQKAPLSRQLLTMVPAVLFVILVFILGFKPDLIAGFLEQAGKDLLDTKGYIEKIMMVITKVGAGV